MLRLIDTADLIRACLATGASDSDAISRVAGFLGLGHLPTPLDMRRREAPSIPPERGVNPLLGQQAPVDAAAREETAASVVMLSSAWTAESAREVPAGAPAATPGGISLSTADTSARSPWRRELRAQFHNAKRPLAVTLVRPGRSVVPPDEAVDVDELVPGLKEPSKAFAFASTPSPLVPPRFMRTWLHDLCARQFPFGRIDEARLTTRLARALPVDGVPRRWVARLVKPPVVLVDMSDDTAALHADMQLLVAAIRVELGTPRDDIHFLARQEDADEFLAANRLGTAWRGRTVLILTDLCASGVTADLPLWSMRRIVRALSRALAAITVVSARTRPMPHWVRGVPDVKVRGWSPRWREQSVRDKHLALLAATLAIADSPSLALLRGLRQVLLPGAGVEVEAALLHSHYVASTMGGHIVLQARACVAAASALEDPVLRETVLCALQACGDATASGANEILVAAWSGYRLRTTRLLNGLSRVLSGGDASIADRARFAASLIARLPPGMANLAAARLVALQARLALHLDVPMELAGTAAENSWLFTARTSIGAYWAGQRLTLRDRPRSGDVLLELPDTQPRHLYRLDEQGQPASHHALWRLGRLAASMPEAPSDWMTLDGTVYRMDVGDEQSIWEQLHACQAQGTVLRGGVRALVRREHVLDGYLVDVGVLGFLPLHRSKSAIGDISVEQQLGHIVAVRVVECVQRARHLMLEEIEVSPSTLTSEAIARRDVGDLVRGTVISLGDVLSKVSVEDGRKGLARTTHLMSLPGNVGDGGQSVLGTVQEFVVKFAELAQSSFLLVPKDMDRLWREHSSALVVGGVHRALVVSVSDAGWYVRLPTGLTSFMSRKVVQHRFRGRFVIGHEFDVSIRRISEEYQDLVVQPVNLGVPAQVWKPNRLPAVGDQVTGTISGISDYGIFVLLDQYLVEGMINSSEVSWERNKTIPEEFTKGQILTVVVIDLDLANERVSLSLRQLTPDPWTMLGDQLQAGRIIDGVVSNISEFGMFVKVADGVEGLVHTSCFGMTIGKDFAVQYRPKYPPGTPLRVRVLSFERERRRLSLELED